MFTININNVDEGASTGAVATANNKRDGTVGVSCNTTINIAETQPPSKNSTTAIQQSFLGKAVNKTTQ